MYYKDPNNIVHFLENDSFKHLLPENSIPISDDEAKKIAENTPTRTIIDPREEAKNYLYSTDWYVTRLVETGKPIPENIKDKRKEAREKI